MAGDPQSIAVAVLIVLFGLMQVFFVRDNERVVRESFAIRYENERLLEALERERQEVLHSRATARRRRTAPSRNSSRRPATTCASRCTPCRFSARP